MKIKNLIILTLALAIPNIVDAQNEQPKEIKVGRESIKSRREIKLPKIDNYSLLKCDFHIHTIFSDGIVWPSLRVDEAWEEGLDAIAITDHIEGQPVRVGVEKGNHNYSFDIAKEEALRKNIILIRGGEITRSMPPGHLNALFLKDVNALDKKDYIEALEEAHNQGAFIEWNHPGWGVDSIKWHDVHEKLYQNGWINGIEVFNEFEWYPQALNWVNEKNLTLLCNSDVHDVVDRLYNPKEVKHRPMTLVLANGSTEEAIKEALFARRTLIYFYDTLMGKEELLNKFFAGAVEINEPHYERNGRKYLSIVNRSDVPFSLKRTDKSLTAYPDLIEIPADASIVINIPNTTSASGVRYELKNMIITPNKNLEVSLF